MAFTKATFDYLDSGGLINWQLTAKTAAFTAVSGEGYLVDTSSAAITVTLPAAPSAGDEIIIVDYASNAGTNNITLDPGTLNLRGATDDLVLSTNNQTAKLLYSGATKGWLVTTEAGGVAAAAPDLTVDFLVVAGGGSGASNSAGGGGAGGLRTSYGSTSGGGASAESSLSLATSTDYTVTVGPGGAAVSYNNDGLQGFDSVFSTITSDGGGGGIRFDADDANGGSGGGGNTVVIGSGTAGQGFDGGLSSSDGVNYQTGGGGGGAAAAGSNATSSSGGSGGAGLSVSITGTSTPYAGGGGGAGDSRGSRAGGSGGTGGGGNGGYNGANGLSAGSPNTGGGGGGNGYSSGNGVAGGSGVVILRYPDAYTISETTSGGNVLSFTTDDSTVPGTKITTFTAGANGTIQFST